MHSWRIDNETVLEVARFVDKVKRIGYHQHKKDAFTRGVSELSEDGFWLLTFACWHSLFNSRFTAIDASLYFALPATEVNTSTFSGFLRILHQYDRTRVTTRREGELSKFLLSCSPEFRSMYLLLLSKAVVKGLPMTEVQTLLPIDSIDMEVVYGPLPVLSTSFADLAYPIMVQPLKGDVSPDSLRFGIIHRTAQICGGYRGPELSRTKLSQAMRRDMLALPTPKGFWPGYFDNAGHFYAVDSYPGLEVYRDAQGQTEDLAVRSKSLELWRQVVLLHLSNEPFTVVEDEAGLGDALRHVMADSPGVHLVISDGRTAYSGDAFTVECRTTQSTIHSLWVDDGKAKGFNVWCNGVLRQCLYSFPGKDASLLGSPDFIKRRQLEFFYFELGSDVYLVGKRILWDAEGWRKQPRKDTGVFVEKCALCGSTKWQHQNRGLCCSCIWNMPRIFERYGTGVWIPPSRNFINLRHEGCWHYTLLNLTQYRHAGRYYLEARENGDWRFLDEGQLPP